MEKFFIHKTKREVKEKMTNAEKRGKEILEQLCKTGDWAVENYTNKIMNCSPSLGNCQKCIFDGLNRKCWEAKAEWLNSEYKTKKHFTDYNISIKTYTTISGHVVDILRLIDKEYLDKGE